MSLAVTTSPQGGTITSNPGTLSCRVECLGSETLDQIQIIYRVNGGAWTTSTRNFADVTDGTHTVGILGVHGYTVQWYGRYTWNDRYVGTSDIYTVTWSDTEDPVVTSLTPANSATVNTTASGVLFSWRADDNIALDRVELHVDGAKADEVDADNDTTVYGSYYKVLGRGSHTCRLYVYDAAGNYTVGNLHTFTVANATPTTPASPLVVDGSTSGAKAVNRGTAYTVEWGASTDLNAEDTVTYTLECQYNGGGYAVVASSVSGLSTSWTPSTSGTADLRVKATDGTASSSYLTRTSITVATSTAPNAPTIGALVGTPWREGETHSIPWNEASPRDPEGDAVTYSIQFSASGAFDDIVAIASGITQGATSYAWTLPLSVVATETATCKLRIKAVDATGLSSGWSTSDAFTVQPESAPTVTVVSPGDDDTTYGALVSVVVAVADADSDDVHVELQLSQFADFRTLDWHLDSEDSQTGWTEAADPYSTWTDVPSGGATAGNRVRYTSQVAVPYDTYYARVRVSDGIVTSAWATWSFRVRPDTALPLVVEIDGTEYQVIECRVEERTGGDASPMSLVIDMTQYVAKQPALGTVVSVSSGLGGHGRIWQGTLERVMPQDDIVRLDVLQGDAYLSRLVCTGDQAEADLGANLAAMIDDYGSPLTANHVDLATGVTMALTGGYKSLREHFSDAQRALPGYVLWVDEDADVNWVDQADLGVPVAVIYQEGPA